MAAYVDPIRHYPGARWRHKHWCHCTADTREELHALAAAVGMPRERFQDHTYRWHYDFTPELRAAAVELGAVEITSRELIRYMRRRIAVPG